MSKELFFTRITHLQLWRQGCISQKCTGPNSFLSTLGFMRDRDSYSLLRINEMEEYKFSWSKLPLHRDIHTLTNIIVMVIKRAKTAAETSNLIHCYKGKFYVISNCWGFFVFGGFFCHSCLTFPNIDKINLHQDALKIQTLPLMTPCIWVKFFFPTRDKGRKIYFQKNKTIEFSFYSSWFILT